MKRYELMSKEEIIKAFYVTDVCGSCEKCPVKNKCHDCNTKSCTEEIVDYLNEEIEMVPRYSLIKSDEDLDAMTEKFSTICTPHKSCDGCEYRSRENYAYIRKDACFANWLKVKVEKP